MATNKLYYILLETISEGKGGYIEAGTIWVLQEKLSDWLYLLSKYEGENIGLLKQIEKTSLRELSYEEAHLIIAIPEPISNRLPVIDDSGWIQEGMSIRKESEVEIYDYPGLPQPGLGTVKFKGRLPGKNGISFGVELSKEFSGKGTTNGTFRGKKLFTCDEDCGIFVSILRLRLVGSGQVKKENNHNAANIKDINKHCVLPDSNDDFEKTHKHEMDNSYSENRGWTLNERIVWISDDGPEFGTVKWIGILPDCIDKQYVVGVEFDNAIGTGNGRYKGRQLFRTKRNHASLIPILGLLKAKVYMSMISRSDDSITPEINSKEYNDFTINREGDNAFSNSTFQSKEEWLESNYNIGSKNMSRNLVKIDTPDNDGFLSLVVPKTKSNSSVNFEAPSTIAHARKDIASNTLSERLGKRVCIHVGRKRNGIIRWIGSLPNYKIPDKLFAGIEMDDEDVKCYTAGTFLGERLFDCPENKGFFYPLDKCEVI